MPSRDLGKLWVVGTPIGNLSDLTPRAKEVLNQVDGIFCEDTRRTRALLEALGIENKKLERLDAHVEKSKIDRVISVLKEGQNWALVSDAGMPGVSDPGEKLISALYESEIAVIPIPGVSAVTTLLSVAGVDSSRFIFFGFFPRKFNDFDEQKEFILSQQYVRTGIWFESPERILETFRNLSEHFSDAYVFVGKELTKLHEKFFSGNVTKVMSELQAEIKAEGARGEWCFLIHFSADLFSVKKSSDWVKALQCLLDSGVSASRAALQVSQVFGIAKNEVKKFTIELSKKNK